MKNSGSQRVNALPQSTVADAQVGVVAIGRNEGDRLIRCLNSLKTHLPDTVPIIYVDSGSTDNSVAEAKLRGVHVVCLDMSIPFTGARARNAGFSYLLRHFPHTQYVQFIDGDCELLPEWMPAAVAALDASSALAIVFGRLRERFPDASFYNQLADIEWDVPVGETDVCGGISLMRTSAVKEVDGFNETMICGEEPELCIRLRLKGWTLSCIDADMAIHDMDMHRFGQWWKRSVRGGWAVAEGAAMYAHLPERYMQRERISGWIWGAALPLAALSLATSTHGATLILLSAAYILLLFKIYRYRRQEGEGIERAFIYALFCSVSKVPQVIGQAKYWLNRLQKKPATLIEYKSQS